MQPTWKQDNTWAILPQQAAGSLASASFKRCEFQRSSPKLLINQARYKTEICRSFEENKTCKYGDKCQYAHGHDEVRQINRHPKYKTEPCRTFHSWGFCPYGPRCHFIHNEDQETLDLVRSSPSISPPSSISSYSPITSPTGSSPSHSPTASLFFSEEDPLAIRDQIDPLRSLPIAANPSLLATLPATYSPPFHRRLPVFTRLNTYPE